MRVLISAAAAAAACLPASAVAQDRGIMLDMRTREFAEVRAKVMSAARIMPAELYTYRVAPDVRTFGEELAHIVGVNAFLCGVAVSADPSQDAERLRSGIPTAAGRDSKAEVIRRLAESLEACDSALGSMTDVRALEATFGPYIRASHLTAMVGHTWHVYGKLTLMLRANGIAPPGA